MKTAVIAAKTVNIPRIKYVTFKIFNFFKGALKKNSIYF